MLAYLNAMVTVYILVSVHQSFGYMHILLWLQCMFGSRMVEGLTHSTFQGSYGQWLWHFQYKTSTPPLIFTSGTSNVRSPKRSTNMMAVRVWLCGRRWCFPGMRWLNEGGAHPRTVPTLSDGGVDKDASQPTFLLVRNLILFLTHMNWLFLLVATEFLWSRGRGRGRGRARSMLTLTTNSTDLIFFL